MKNRILYWDNIKGFLIILVVFGHFAFYAQNKVEGLKYLHDAIYIFHMPAFVFVSGFFSKSENAKSTKSLMKLLWAYIGFNLIFISIKVAEGASIKFFTPYFSAWYLLSLITWRLSVKHIAKTKHLLIITVLCAILAGFAKDISNQWALTRTFAFFPFFMVGYSIEKENIEKIMNWRPQIKFLVGGATLLIGAILEILGYKTFHYTENQLIMFPYRDNAVDPFARASILLTATVIILGILIITPNKKMGILSKAGRNSLSIFLLHRPIVYMIGKTMGDIYQTRVLYAICIIGTIVLVTILGTDKISELVNNGLNKLTEMTLGIQNNTNK